MSYRDDFRIAEKDTYWSMPRVLLLLLATMILLFILSFVADAMNLFSFKFWEPKREDARRQVYERTQSYHKGNMTRLSDLCNQVAAADDDHKTMLNDTIVQEFSDVNMDDVTDYLRPCLSRARAN